ncbi:hypothetical protein FHT67_006017 [Paenibacillus sp. BK720]|nr:hypothetical protein [Paenibacillus sp. BK720]
MTVCGSWSNDQLPFSLKYGQQFSFNMWYYNMEIRSID